MTTLSATNLTGVLAHAAQNAERGSDLVIASGQVVAKRVALGVAAAFDPLRADHAEFGRMVPEKVEALSAAGQIVLDHSGDANAHIARLASHEMLATARATLAMAGCTSPAALMQAQMSFALGWFERATANFFALGLLTLKAQDAAMAPFRATVAANGARLAA